MIDEKTLGEFILQKRKQLKITQVQLSNKIYVDPKTLSKWENGLGYPDIESLYKLSEIFNFSLDEVLSQNNLEIRKIKNKTRDKNILIVLVFFLCSFSLAIISLHRLFNLELNVNPKIKVFFYLSYTLIFGALMTLINEQRHKMFCIILTVLMAILLLLLVFF